MQVLESMDVYAKPVGDFLTIKKSKKVSTAWGLCCTFIMMVFVALAAGFLIADMIGTTNYFSQSIAWTVAPLGTTPYLTQNSEIIIAYNNNLEDNYMLGAFF